MAERPFEIAPDLARGAGNRKSLQCAYHGWLYGLDGCLKRTPEFEGVENFRKGDFGLVPVRLDTWGPFAFVNLDGDAPPLAEVMGKIPEETARFDFSRLRRVERWEYPVPANWKVYIDNYLEGYHIPVAHPGLYRELGYERYRVESFRHYSRQHAPIRPVRAEDAVARTLTIFEWYHAEPGTPEIWNALQESIAFSDRIQQEDIELCQDVQANLRTDIYDRGRFSVARENGVHHFQRLYTEYLAR